MDTMLVTSETLAVAFAICVVTGITVGAVWAVMELIHGEDDEWRPRVHVEK